MAYKVIVLQKKNMSCSFLNSGTLIVNTAPVRNVFYVGTGARHYALNRFTLSSNKFCFLQILWRGGPGGQ